MPLPARACPPKRQRKQQQQQQRRRQQQQQLRHHTPKETPLDEGDDGEWDMNNGKHCLEMLEHKFTQQDLHKSGLSITQFGKVCEFYIDFLKRKTPKASLAFHFTADIDHGIFSTSKQRLEWLKSFAAQRALQYVQKPKPTTK